MDPRRLVSTAGIAAVVLCSACAGLESAQTTQGAGSSTATSTAASDATGGSRVAGSFTSAALGREMAYEVYLPPGYDESVRYPVLYLYDGYGGNEKNWFEALGIDRYADELVAAGDIEPLLIVSADVEDSYGINSPLGDFEDYVVRDVVHHIDESFSTIPERSGRYIGGLSMGGFVALHAAFRHPDVFSKVGGHSAALWTDDWSQVEGLQTFLYPDDETRAQRDPIRLARTADVGELEVWLDCGTEDALGLFDGAAQLEQILTERGVRVQYHSNPGGHEAAYWQEHGDDYLRFYAGRG